MDLNITIKDALNFLNPEEDDDWTNDGMPRMDVVEKLIDDKSITRQNVTDADPEFCRDVARTRKAEKEADDVVVEEVEEVEEQPITKLELDQQIDDVQNEIGNLEKLRDNLSKERDRLQNLEYGGHTAAADTQARLDYVKSQNELRASRHIRRAEVFKMVRAQDIRPGSPLDASMSRRTARGTRRPSRPLMKEE